MAGFSAAFSRHSIAIVALTFAASTFAAAAERPAKPGYAKAAQASAMVKARKQARVREYENVAGFNARVDDPLYSFAAEPPPSMGAPVITNFPMPHTVWW